MLQTHLPQLVSSFNVTENKPGIKILEGIEGIKEAYLDTIREGAEIWSILNTTNVEPDLLSWLTKTYVKKRVGADIWAKVIVAHDKNSADYVTKNTAEKRETKLVKTTNFAIANEMNIYGNKIAFMNFKKNTAHIAVIINDATIAETMRALFWLAWEGADTTTNET